MSPWRALGCTPQFPFHTELFGLNTCLLSYSLTSAKAGTAAVFFAPVPWSLAHGTVQSIHEPTSCVDRTKKNWRSPSPWSSERAWQSSSQTLKAGQPLHLMQHAIRKEPREGILGWGEVVIAHSYRTSIHSANNQD